MRVGFDSFHCLDVEVPVAVGGRDFGTRIFLGLDNKDSFMTSVRWFVTFFLVVSAALVSCQSETSETKQPKTSVTPPRNTTVNVTDIRPGEDPIRQAVRGSALPSAEEDPRKKHGDNAILRAGNRLPDEADTSSEYTLLEPDWTKPYPLTYVKLKRNYQYFLVKKHFIAQGLPKVHGGAVTLSGSVMPLETPGPNGELRRFWLANPTVVMAGCVFCNPPTLADLVYVEVKGEPLKVDREKLYRGIVRLKIMGRFFLGADKTADGAEYIYKMELKEVLERF